MFNGNSQLQLIDWDYSELSEVLFDPQATHNTGARFGSFSFLMLKKGEKAFGPNKVRQQWSFPLSELPERLPEFIEQAIKEKKELYISQSSFSYFNRRRTNFFENGCLFLDIDCYDYLDYYNLSKEEMADIILKYCEQLNIPLPSVIIDSGGGLYAKWFIDKIHKRELSYWEQVEKHLCEAFKQYGADRKALDISRVLRVVGSYNNKREHEPRLCKILYINYVGGKISRTRLYDIGQKVLPHTLQQAQAFNEKKRQSIKLFKKRGREIEQGQLVWQAMIDLNEGGHWSQIKSPEDLRKYILTCSSVYGVKSLSKDIVKTKYDEWKKYEFKTDEKIRKSGGKIHKASSVFRMRKRNWGSHLDIINYIQTTYGGEAPSGIRNSAVWICCNQYALSEYFRKSEAQIWEEFKQIRNKIAPMWSDIELSVCVASIADRLKRTQAGEKGDMGFGLPLYSLSDAYIQEALEINSEALQLVDESGNYIIQEVLGEDERNRRDPNRLQRKAEAKRTSNIERKKVKRRAAGMATQDDYNNKRAKAKAELAKAVQELVASGMKGKDIAAKLGIDAGYVSKLKKID